MTIWIVSFVRDQSYFPEIRGTFSTNVLAQAFIDKLVLAGHARRKDLWINSSIIDAQII